MIDFSERRVQRSLSFDAGSSAVLVVDMLNDFLEPTGAMPLPEGQRLYQPIGRLLAAARAHGSPVIWVCDAHPSADREFEKRAVHCIAGTWGAQIVGALQPRDEEYRVFNWRNFGFYETDLDLRLRELGIAHVILAGVVTNICVRSTAHDAFFRGYDVIVVEDCVAATGEREQASSLYDIETHFGAVSSLEEVLTIFEQAASR